MRHGYAHIGADDGHLDPGTKGRVIKFLHDGLSVPEIARRMPHVSRSHLVQLAIRHKPSPLTRLRASLDAKVKVITRDSDPEAIARIEAELLARDAAAKERALPPEPHPRATPEITASWELARAHHLVTPAPTPASPPEESPPMEPTALERARALRRQQEELVEQLQEELVEVDARAAEIRGVLEELGAAPAKAKRKARKGTPRDHKPRRVVKEPAGGSIRDRVLSTIASATKPVNAAKLAEQLDASAATVAATLGLLARSKLIRRAGRGLYEAAA